MAIYVVSDIHGYYDLFLKGLSDISFSDNDFLWCLGDAIDKGPDGIKVMQYIKSHKNMDMLIGNHEFMFLNSVDPSGVAECNGEDTLLWLKANSGSRTFEQYKELSLQERKELLAWLKSRYVTKIVEHNDVAFCLTHSFYKSDCKNMRYSELDYMDVWYITWSSIWREDSTTRASDIYDKYPYTFISGHVPIHNIRRWHDNEIHWNILKPYYHENVINIDGGCAMGRESDIDNGLIFLRLNDMKEFTIHFRDEFNEKNLPTHDNTHIFNKKIERFQKYKRKLKKLYHNFHTYPPRALPLSASGEYVEDDSKDVVYYKRIYNNHAETKYLKKISNRKVRKNQAIPSKKGYKKAFDLQWILWTFTL